MKKYTVTVCETRYFYTDIEIEARSEEEIEALSTGKLINLTTESDWEERGMDNAELEIIDIKEEEQV